MRRVCMISVWIFIIVCLGNGGLFAYKDFFVPETEKVRVVEEKVEQEKAIPEQPVVLLHEEKVKELNTKVEEIAIAIQEKQAALQQIGTKIKEIIGTKIREIGLKLEEIRPLKETPTPTTTETAEVKPVVDEITGKEKDAKAQETSAAEEKIKKLIAEVKQEIKENQKAAIAEQQLMQEITGLIIEETMTKIGYEFYEYFFLLWETPQTELKHYNIVITERASPSWGSLVEVKIGETTVWSRMLRPRSEEIEESAKQAIEATKNYLQNYEKYQLKTIDMMGTGI